VFTVLLSRYTNETDIVIGSPVANRNREEIEGLIGFFANNLVMRTDLSGEPTAREVIQRVRSVALNAYEHQDLPFEQLVNELKPARDPSRNPLFQVGFAVQNTPDSEEPWHGLTVEPMDTGHYSTRFDLECHVLEDAQGLRLVLVYNVDLFKRSTISRFGGHFLTLLEGVVADPDQHISALPLMKEDELAKLDSPIPQDDPVRELPIRSFEAQVERTPDARAVVTADRQVSFAELNRAANRLAHELRGMGVGPEVVVALCAERGPEMVMGTLAILKAGGAFLPIDPENPSARIQHLLSDSLAPLVLVSEHLSELIPETPACKRIKLDGARSGPEANLEPLADLANAAYVIYTSGSTGSPKGVVVENRSLAHLLAAHQDLFGLGVEDRATQIANISFDASVFEMWPALTSGAELHVPDKETLLDPGSLVNWASQQGITYMWLPTALAELAMREPWPAECSLRTLTVAGDRLGEVPDIPLPFRVFNLYGPTENTVWSTECEVAPGSSSPPIGRPIKDTYVRVLDGHLNRVPIGVPGELFLGGAGLARGYLNRPDLDAERFIEDPFGDHSATRLYATGDMVRYLADGQLEFLGRNDEQVKIRGHRVELGEIESILKSDPSVDDAVAVVREDKEGDPWLVAYLVPTRDGGSLNSTGGPDHDHLTSLWRNRISGQVPSYMVPSAFVVMDHLPLNPNGKVDRGALPAPSGPRGSEVPYAEPCSDSERLVASIWRDVLHEDTVGRNDNFFELGGHSLLATQVMSRLRDELDFEVPLRAMFEAPVLRALAERVDEARAEQDQGGPALKKAPRTRKVTRPR
jgi:amino acid adenylation domain-containing protein